MKCGGSSELSSEALSIFNPHWKRRKANPPTSLGRKRKRQDDLIKPLPPPPQRQNAPSGTAGTLGGPAAQAPRRYHFLAPCYPLPVWLTLVPRSLAKLCPSARELPLLQAIFAITKPERPWGSPLPVASVPPMPGHLKMLMALSECPPTSDLLGASARFSVASPRSQAWLPSAEGGCFRQKAGLMGRARSRLGKRGAQGRQADHVARALLHSRHVPRQPRTLSVTAAAVTTHLPP